uniref:Uncharacterized protein n=1 Tax=Romanomermis culicivorax TaxID=13658 RepID=A0A915JJF8_ROMCU
MITDTDPNMILGMSRPEIDSDNDWYDQFLWLKVIRSIFALFLPMIYGLINGSESKWSWTSFYLWTKFLGGRKPDKQRLSASLIMWSILSFIFWTTIFAVSGASLTGLLYFALYFLFNGCLLFMFNFKTMCQRPSQEEYQTI